MAKGVPCRNSSSSAAISPRMASAPSWRAAAIVQKTMCARVDQAAVGVQNVVAARNHVYIRGGQNSGVGWALQDAANSRPALTMIIIPDPP